jgi:chemotaxis protein methyltransferase CheR
LRIAATRVEATDRDLEEIELKLLLEAVSMRYGYDFRDYAVGPLRRGIDSAMAGEGVSTISAYQDRLLHDRGSIQRFLAAVGVSASSMFREPATWRCIREEVAPRLRTYPSVRVWSVGCATGEEVYSLAILLEEEGITDDVQIYATDLNQQLLEQARRGSYTLDRMRDYERNYLEAGGRRSLADYYTVSGNHARIRPSMQRRVTWAEHNLVTDGSFNEFHLIVCINVLIYFRPTLQQRAHRLFYDSLVRSAFLALGQRENLIFCPESSRYEALESGPSVYRKVS